MIWAEQLSLQCQAVEIKEHIHHRGYPTGLSEGLTHRQTAPVSKEMWSYLPPHSLLSFYSPPADSGKHIFLKQPRVGSLYVSSLFFPFFSLDHISCFCNLKDWLLKPQCQTETNTVSTLSNEPQGFFFFFFFLFFLAPLRPLRTMFSLIKRQILIYTSAR